MPKIEIYVYYISAENTGSACNPAIFFDFVE